MRQPEYTFFLLFLMAAALIFRFSGCERETIPSNKITAYFPRQGDDPEHVLLHLYSKVNKGGYIYMAIFSFTNTEICNALKAA